MLSRRPGVACGWMHMSITAPALWASPVNPFGYHGRWLHRTRAQGGRTGRLVCRCRSGKRHRMITARPPETGDPRWDAFVAGLAEWLAVQAGMPAPGWVRDDNRYLRRGWWVTPMKSMRAWEY